MKQGMNILSRVRWSVVLVAIVLAAFAQVSYAGPSEAEIRKFLHSTDGTYGWEPEKGDLTYDFFKDGRVHIQGPDGEATMWEGKWTLKGDQLTIVNPEKKTKLTVTVTIEGDELLLDDVRYTRIQGE